MSPVICSCQWVVSRSNLCHFWAEHWLAGVRPSRAFFFLWHGDWQYLIQGVLSQPRSWEGVIWSIAPDPYTQEKNLIINKSLKFGGCLLWPHTLASPGQYKCFEWPSYIFNSHSENKGWISLVQLSLLVLMGQPGTWLTKWCPKRAFFGMGVAPLSIPKKDH